MFTFTYTCSCGYRSTWPTRDQAYADMARHGLENPTHPHTDVFYYRVHSPVALIEFDHQRGIAFDSDEPTRDHIHTVVRTPNGNDYGRDLLRQHHAQFDHVHADHRHR